ncbi:MAG: glycoside hydrolase family 3 C-terminal domain-containing protein [Deltaproteobacteria bacterium]|nr:glycoside hydrolase family 3 C-terminal domain-containing protein [Deltaproteobacteria bacterium]
MTEENTRVEELLGKLTLDEKATLTAGSSIWHGGSVPRLGIPALKVTDGPIGARGGNFGGGVSAACFPNASALGATWNTDLVEEVGVALGEEALTKRSHVLLGPTLNMHRSPLGGRHFENYSEDPHLTSRLAVAFVRGVQSQGVGTSPKHYVANDSEFERHTIDSQVSERALREIYLAPFEAAVVEAGAWTVMGAYNAVNGTPACAHRELLVDVLKQEWGFDGLVVSDWFAVQDTPGPANGGLDLEMPGPPRFFGPALAQAVKDGSVSEAELDDKVRRILRIMARTGALDAPEIEEPEQAIDRPEHRALALRAASEALVLLKNEPTAAGANVLPLRRKQLRRLAVIGPNARPTSIQGGGSARVLPHYERHILDAIREACGDDIELVHAQGCTSHKSLPVIDPDLVEPGAWPDKKGFEAHFFNGLELAGEAVLVRRMRSMDTTWFGRFDPAVDPNAFSVRISGQFTPRATGAHQLALTCAGKARLFVDGELVIDNWSEQVRGEGWFGTGSREEIASLPLVAGEPALLVVEYTREGAVMMGGLKLGHHPPVPDDPLGEAEQLAASADAAIVVVGLNAEWETEGHDKQEAKLPGKQQELIERVAAANPCTAVVVNAGAPLMMEWAETVPAILWAWYGGQEAGTAVAEALFGDTNPSGKLPTTFARSLTDVPCHTGSAEVYPGEDGRVVYAEDLHVGHRHYDAAKIDPHFAFGHGLSYTSFELGRPHLSAEASDLASPLVLTVPVRNTGGVSGQEVVQCYVHDLESRLPRPERELKAFGKIALAPGADGQVTLELNRRAFSYWDPDAHDWVAEPGAFELHVGTSSRELSHCLAFELQG